MINNKLHRNAGILPDRLYLLSWIFLAALIVLSPRKLIYDEGYHLGVANLIQTQGFYSAMVSPLNQSAAGPLYAFLHLAFESATNLAAPFVRWINFLGLLIVAFLISKTKWPIKYQNISFPGGFKIIFLLVSDFFKLLSIVIPARVCPVGALSFG